MNKFYIGMGLLVVLGLAFGIYRQATVSQHVVVVYSPMPDGFMEDMNRLFEELHPDIQVQTVRASTVVLENSIRSEKDHPVGDVMYAGDLPTYLELKKEGLIQPVDIAVADHIPVPMKDPDKTWYAAYQLPIVIFFNDVLLPPDQAPKDWGDLLAPQLKGAIMIRNPMQSGVARAFYLAVFNAWGESAAVEFFKKLDTQMNKQFAASNDMLLVEIVNGDAKVSVLNEADILMAKHEKKYPLTVVYPNSGAFVTPEPIAMIANAPHPEAAKKYMEFIMDYSALELAATKYYKRPARADYPQNKLPLPLQVPIKAQPVDWLSIGDQGTIWLRKWNEDARRQKKT